MKNFYLILSLSTIILLPIKVIANSWSSDDPIYRYVSSYNEPSYIAELDLSKEFELVIYFTNVKSDECIEYSNDIYDADVWYINKQAVKMLKQCIEHNKITYFANTDNGKEFIIDQFRRSKMVIAEGKVFTAEGFKKAYDQLNIPLNKPI